MDKTDSKNDSTTVSLDTEKADCNGDNETEKADSIKDEKADSTKEEKADGGNKLIAFVTKLFKPRSDVVADKNVIGKSNLQNKISPLDGALLDPKKDCFSCPDLLF